MKNRIVVALGGNALGFSPEKQIENAQRAARTIARMIAEGHEIVIGHGNGPQVGIINSAMDYAFCSGPQIPFMPFAECNAMSQGYIGYHLQQALQNCLRTEEICKPVVSVVTQVRVDRNDPAFDNPTKPIGAVYSKKEALEIQKEKGTLFVEDAGRGYRRVVPSPMPLEIIEIESIRSLVRSGTVVITVGGGGIPVIESGGRLEGISAVIDKDKSCARLASDLDADMLLILTAVDKVCINYNKPDQIEISSMSVPEAKEYIKEGHFAAGSMLPKIEACIRFLGEKPGGRAVISSLENAYEAFLGNAGTLIYS